MTAGVGMIIAVRIKMPDAQGFPAAFVFGSVLFGLIFFFVSLNGTVNQKVFLFILAVGFLSTAFTIKKLAISFRIFLSDIKAYVFPNKRSLYLYGSIIILIISVYVLLTLTPPRSADALRYHLAQLKDIVSHGGLEFRPYYHYNFPMYFSMFLLPVYFFAGGVGMKTAHCLFFFMSVLMTIPLAKKCHVKFPLLLIFLLLLTPISYHEAHIVTNDWAVVFYVICGFFLLSTLNDSEKVSAAIICIAFLSLGFALGIKYHSVLFIPWFILVALKYLNDKKLKPWRHISVALIIMTICASVWYIRNLLNTGNPCWPMLLSFFSDPGDYLYIMASRTTQSLSGSHSLASIAHSFRNFLFFPMIPFTIWMLTFAGLYFNKKNDLFLKTGVLLYFILWWFFQPELYPRFGIYILPIALIISDHVYLHKSRVLKYGYNLAIGVTLCYGAVLGGFYSIDYLKYHFEKDIKAYHQFTWYYQELSWINKNLEPDSRLLVILSSPQTYYLDVEYIRADPALSASIDWRRIKNIDDFKKKISELKIDYILYEGSGGLLEEFRKSPDVRTIWERNILKCDSRIRRAFSKTRLTLAKTG